MQRLIILIWIIVFVPMLFVTAGKEEGLLNKSASTGQFWSTAKEEGDLFTKQRDADDNHHHDNLDGGFSSLEGMLQWAIGHSDPSKLKETAKDVQHLSPDELKERHIEIKDLMEKLKMPSDAELMQIAINDLNNASLPLEDHQRALQELLILVEPIDNANDLSKMGGLAVVIRELNHPEPQIRTISAWIIGKASQSNPVVQKQVLQLGALVNLMEMVQSNFTEEAVKALYAVSALIRNNFAGQKLFHAEAGGLLLQNILSNSSSDIRLTRKSLSLVAALAECQLENRNKAELPFFSNRFFLKSVVDHLVSNDIDLQEKALYAIKSLLQLKSTEVRVLKDFCQLDVALERMRKQLQQLMVEQDDKEFAMDVESLRIEVETDFQKKLNKVPT